ncbi:molecular chaperone HtpG [Winogradskya humida]|uniref:Chaperone protein HtpG n=1 Tax=Winogradskya humida TaxID=113566 RepID=A0ABQ3ZJ62_9ACTN|nr:molecular chaperone HtpG [Actinoplanes humidus]GIE18624.1 chaperone protein HtpG [Actinoplanes humidus]
MSTETLEFQAEARQLLQLMVHSIYSNKDIFLRELISNASDALDKLRLAALTDDELTAEDLHIEVVADAEARTLTVRDNGIGMARDEVVTLIGTIAKSGTADLLRRMKENKDKDSAELIGQFGVGFYSTFMVADRVTLVTRKAGEETGTRWESAGEGTYTIEEAADVATGTSVTVHLRPKDEEDALYDYTDEWKIKEIVKRYSDFISFPILLVKAAPAPKAEPDAEGSDDEASDDEASAAPETLNSMKALWARPRSDVKDEEYAEFYRHISHDWTDPLEIIQMRAEGTFEYEALLFIPSRAPHDLFQRDGARGIQLYVKRVFIMDDSRELMPDYLRFVKGVVDAADLSLNISREILQQDRHIQMIRRRLAKKVLSTVKDLMTKDAEKYATFWREFGRAVKEGLLSEQDDQKAILDVSSFASTASADPTTLAGYVSRMKDGQDEIYFMTGESRAQVENSPHMEAFQAKGYEVLLLTDPVDEIWVEAVPEYEGKKLQSIARGNVDLSADEDKPSQEKTGEFAPLLTWLGETLDEVKEVRLTSRLTTSPACLVSDANDITPTLEKMYKAMGQDVPPVKRILELNPDHPLVTGLRDAYAGRAEDPALPETAELLYGTALLAEGGDLADPARFAKLLADRLARTV